MSIVTTTTTTNTLKELINLLKANNNKTLNPKHFINSNGLSKHKDSLYIVIQKILNPNKILQAPLKPIEADLEDILRNYNVEFLHSLEHSLLTSYFTPEYVTGPIVKGLDKYYSNKNFIPSILETSAGTGNIVSYLSEFFNKSNITAIEKDIFSSLLLENNFKNNSLVQTKQSSFEQLDISKSNMKDLIISNIPFGNFGVFDKNIPSKYYPLYKGHIQNFFFMKASMMLNKGGIIAFITTSSFSDRNHTQELRKHLVKDLNLISAYRFDNKTFKDSNTSVVADLIIFQKPNTKKKGLTYNDSLFIQSESLKVGNNDYHINKYFSENSKNVLGEFSEATQHFGNLGLTLNKSLNENEIQEILLENISKSLHFRGEKIIETNQIDNSQEKGETKEEVQSVNDKILELYPNIKPGNYILFENQIVKAKLHEVHNKLIYFQTTTLKSSEKQLINDLIPVREAYKALIVARRNSDNNEYLKQQTALNNAYDLFNFYHGYLNVNRNLLTVSKDSDSDLLFSLESKVKNIKHEYEKTSVFSIGLVTEEKKINNLDVEEAIIASFNNHGYINETYINSICTTKEWKKEALEKELLFVNPVFDEKRQAVSIEFVLKSKFLSGYINEKINFFKRPKKELFKENQNAFKRALFDNYHLKLLDVKPNYLKIKEIDPILGEPWIKSSVFENFAREHFKEYSFKIKYVPSINNYQVKGPHSTYANDLYAVNIPGSRFVGYQKIMEYALYQNTPYFTKTIIVDRNATKVTDQNLITAVQLKVDKLNLAFSQWLIDNKKISNVLEQYYNYTFNSFVKEDFKATDFDFNIQGINPYDHQKNGAWQLIQNNGGILDHKVGFGKTATMCMSISKRLDIKITNKELVVGLNANYEALYKDFKQFYPDKKILLVKPTDISPGNLDKTFYNIANNNWDIVVTAHSCLLKFPKAPETSKLLYQELLNEAKETLDNGELTSRQQRELNKKIENIKSKLEYFNSIIQAKKVNSFITFEDLNFDHITVDESHYFKNLSFSTIHSRVAGLGSQKEVQKTANLLSYIRSIQHKYKSDKGVTFSTGTTISNSLVELYTLFRYLTPKELEKQGVYTFDQWARIYTRKSQEYEESISGEIKLKERFRYYVKVPELAQYYKNITHYADDTTFKIEKPELNTQLISVEAYQEQKQYFEAIKQFGKTKNPKGLIGVGKDDNSKKAAGLICTSQGRKAALDMRLISPDFEDHPLSKINTMINKSIEVYNQYEKEQGVQLIFCDMGTPTSKGFNLYQAIKDNLIKKGIPENEITFIHSHSNKAKLFKKVNNGEIRFLIGSTQKMGVGVNAQKKLVAMHHLDFPWRPTDMEQRNGRGDRQGNELLPMFDNKMKVFYYAKKGSVDAYIFNLLQIKYQFISQIKNASISTRTIDEGTISEDGSMSFEHYMAACSENQEFTEKLKLEKELFTYLNYKQAYDQNNRSTENKLRLITEDQNKRINTIDCFKKDYEEIKLYLLNNEKGIFELKINDTIYKNPKEVSLYLKQRLDSLIKNNKTGDLCNIYDNYKITIFKKSIEDEISNDNYKIFVETPGGYKIGYNNNILVKDDKTAGNYIFNALNRLPYIINQQENLLKSEQNQINRLESILQEPFKHSEKIEDLRDQIQSIEESIKAKENKKDDQSQDKGNKPRL